MPSAVTNILGRLSNLPPFPKVAAKLLTVLDNPSVSVRELSEIIAMDPSLVMKVIHTSNSPFYMLSKQVENVNQAVLVLGIRTIKTITTAAAVIQSVERLQPRTDIFDIMQFWKHSYATAIAATKLSRQILQNDGNRLYLTGLVHDIGKLTIAYYWPDTWKQIINRMKNDKLSYENAEKEMFVCTHTEITVELFRKWNFPDYMIELIRNQQHDVSSVQNCETETGILCLADSIASHCELAFPIQGTEKSLPDKIDEYSATKDSLKEEVAYQLKYLSLKK